MAHLPILKYVANIVKGPILDLGYDTDSTMLLRDIAFTRNIPLISVVSHQWPMVKHLASPNHTIVSNVDQCAHIPNWGMVFINHPSWSDRVKSVHHFKTISMYLVITDADFFPGNRQFGTVQRMTTHNSPGSYNFDDMFVSWKLFFPPTPWLSASGPPTLVASSQNVDIPDEIPCQFYKAIDNNQYLVIEQCEYSGWGDNVMNILAGLVLTNRLKRIPLLAFRLPLYAAFDMAIEPIHGNHNMCCHIDHANHEHSLDSLRKVYTKPLVDIFSTRHKCIHYKTYYPIMMFNMIQEDMCSNLKSLFAKYCRYAHTYAEKTIVVHIRTGDGAMKSDHVHTETCPCIRPEQLSLMLDSLPSALPYDTTEEVCLISDSPTLIDIVREKLPKYKWTQASTSIPRHSDVFTHANDDNFTSMLHDFYTIYNASTAVVCQWSNFGKLASYLGKCKNVFLWDLTFACRRVEDMNSLLVK